MLESVFTFLFKYRPAIYQHGQLGFDAPWPVAATLIAGALLLGAALLAYGGARPHLGQRDFVVLTVLRTAIVGLLVFALLRPVLVVSTVVPQENVLAIVLDDSRSMQLADRDGETRGAFVTETFAASDSPVLQELGERFKLRFFRFGTSVARHDPGLPLTFGQSRTDLKEALHFVRRELAGVPLAGVVLVTDGADNATNDLTDPLLQFKADQVPIYTVGVGRDALTRDIEVSRVEAPERVLLGSSVMVDVMLVQSGFRGDRVTLNVEDNGRIVTSQDIRLAGDREATMVRVQLLATEPGPRLFRFHVPQASGELVAENNVREVMVTVDDRREKILYFEGEPRFEVKFIRRAIADDNNLRVVTLQRTAENKFLRLGVEDADELAGGFPRTREELFTYRGIMLGSVEASFFAHDQLKMIEEFVGQRGGGLLVLGGRLAFAEGGYHGTQLANVLPVIMEPSADPEFFRTVEVQPTPTGRGHPVTRIGNADSGSTLSWAGLPALSILNPLARTKPGASTLLTGRADDGGDVYTVLAFQRYGKGTSIAFPVQDSWLWQMHADVPLEDLTHETFWRQMLRWLVSNVPDQIHVSTPAEDVEPGETISMTAEVRDSSYLGINGAEVEATVTDPLGNETTHALEWTVEEDGVYRAELATSLAGRYDVRVTARHGDRELGSALRQVRVEQHPTEYFGAHMRAPFLKNIAAETGGRFYREASIEGLTEDVRYTESGATRHESHDLWDMPIVFLVLLGSIAAEWGLRRFRGLA